MKIVFYAILLLVASIVIYSVIGSVVGFFSESDFFQARERGPALFFSAGDKHESDPSPEVGVGTSAPIEEPEKREPISRERQLVPPLGFTEEQLSPHFQAIKISSIRRSRTWGGDAQFRLTAGSFEGVKNITNWRLKTNSGEFSIPKAVADYKPGGGERTSIVLNSREYVNFYSWGSPLVNGLRVNKCIGFLNNFYDFSPSFSNSCPRSFSSRDEIAVFTGECQSFVLSLRRCQQPTAEELNKFSGPANRDCHAFLRTINYGNCYSKHAKDSDFWSREWRVWLNRALPFDPRHDRVLLLDENGLLVDVRTY